MTDLRFREVVTLTSSWGHAGSHELTRLFWCDRERIIPLPNSQENNYGALGRIRTCDLWYRKPTLYPTELRARTKYKVQKAEVILPNFS